MLIQDLYPVIFSMGIVEINSKYLTFARVRANGTTWHRNYYIHREGDEPAHYNILKKVWYKYGRTYRENDQPTVVWKNDTVEWQRDGKLHRENGRPALIAKSGQQEWWVNGKLHRENGPALIYADGVKEWWLKGRNVTFLPFHHRF